jgi:hypothetical protein
VTRRQVRVTPQFFGCLDQLLPAERGADGAPSATDFLAYDLPRAIDRLADDYEGCTLPGDQEGTRVLITAGLLVPFFVLHTAVASDGAVEIYYLIID